MFNPHLDDELSVVREIVSEAVQASRPPGEQNQRGNGAGRVNAISPEMAFPATSATLTGALLIEYQRGGPTLDEDGAPVWALLLDQDSLDASQLA